MTTPQRKILLTGGAGFIGSHVAEAFLQRGAQLTIVDTLDDFYSPQRKRANLEEVRRRGEFQFEQADICDAERMRAIFAATQPDAVIHLAARAGHAEPAGAVPRISRSAIGVRFVEFGVWRG
jgi:UDP-glucuronate 4-epimerase